MFNKLKAKASGALGKVSKAVKGAAYAALATVAGATGMAMTSAPAEAALPTEATAAFTGLLADFQELVTQMWTIVPVVVVSFLVIDWFRKGANKAK